MHFHGQLRLFRQQMSGEGSGAQRKLKVGFMTSGPNSTEQDAHAAE